MFNLFAAQVVAKRVFSQLYIYLDIVFLVALLFLLFFKKRYLTLLFGLFGGILYMIVDYGIFHLATGSRHIIGGDMFWVLLWMSLSYGITNFVLIWTWMGKDRHAVEFTLFIFVWWIAAPILAQSFGGNLPTVTIWRETNGYHGAMALILFAGYAAAIVYNLCQKDKIKRFPLLRLLAIGIGVQFAWEFALLAGGIRSDGFDLAQKMHTMIVNSLLETNLGAVPIFAIYIMVTARFTEDLKRRAPAPAFTQRIAELNLTRFSFGLSHKPAAGVSVPDGADGVVTTSLPPSASTSAEPFNPTSSASASSLSPSAEPFDTEGRTRAVADEPLAVPTSSSTSCSPSAKPFDPTDGAAEKLKTK